MTRNGGTGRSEGDRAHNAFSSVASQFDHTFIGTPIQADKLCIKTLAGSIFNHDCCGAGNSMDDDVVRTKLLHLRQFSNIVGHAAGHGEAHEFNTIGFCVSSCIFNRGLPEGTIMVSNCNGRRTIIACGCPIVYCPTKRNNCLVRVGSTNQEVVGSFFHIQKAS